MAMYGGFSHEKWWFSIVMLVYQRVTSDMPKRPPVFFLKKQNIGREEKDTLKIEV